jgi:hypothetical protein
MAMVPNEPAPSGFLRFMESQSTLIALCGLLPIGSMICMVHVCECPSSGVICGHSQVFCLGIVWL